MPKILRILQTAGGKNFTGYLTVVDVPADGKEPVSLDTVKSAIASAQAKLSHRPNQKQQRAIVLAKSKSANKAVLAVRKPTKPNQLSQGAPASLKPSQLTRQQTAENLEPMPIAY